MGALLLLLALVGVSIWVLICTVFPSGSRLVRPGLTGLALFAGATSGWPALYVAGEDDYRNDGTTRWEAYDAQGLTVAAVLAGFLVCLLALSLIPRPRRRFLPALGLAGLFAAGLIVAAFIANTAN